jgi:hypothetical protein
LSEAHGVLKPRFFVVYAYGQGGVWAVVEAPRRELIAQRFPELQVFDERPSWMTDPIAGRLEGNVIDLNEPTSLLADILRDRQRR